MPLVLKTVCSFLLGSFVPIYLGRPDNLQGGSCKIFSFRKKLAVGVQGVSPPFWLDLLRPALGHRGTQVSAMYQPAPTSPGQSPQPPVPALPPHPWPRWYKNHLRPPFSLFPNRGDFISPKENHALPVWSLPQTWAPCHLQIGSFIFSFPICTHLFIFVPLFYWLEQLCWVRVMKTDIFALFLALGRN